MLITGKGLLLAEVTLKAQLSLCSRISAWLPAPRIFCAGVGKAHSANEQSRSWMEYYYYSLNIGIKKRRNCRRLLSISFQVPNVKLMREERGVSEENASMECGKPIVVLDKRGSGLNYKEKVLLRKSYEVCAIRRRDTEILYCQIVPAQFYRKSLHGLVLNYQLSNFNVEYVCRSIADIHPS